MRKEKKKTRRNYSLFAIIWRTTRGDGTEEVLQGGSWRETERTGTRRKLCHDAERATRAAQERQRTRRYGRRQGHENNLKTVVGDYNKRK